MSDRQDSPSPHIFLSCGEASGERYGTRLVAALRTRFPAARFSALGGDELASVGVELICRRDEISVMGFGEVVSALPAIWRARNRMRRHLVDGGVDLFIPIDYPGFNVGLAVHARKQGVPVFYLVAPQLWAWGGWRVGKLRRAVDRLGVLLPFEERYFRERNIAATWLGHPLVESYPKPTSDQARRIREGRSSDESAVLTVGLLPGSRRQEITRLLPVMLAAVAGLKRLVPNRKFRCIVSRAPGVEAGLLEAATVAGHELSTAPLSDLASELDLSLVCSGTASLEMALAGVPHALAYRTSGFNYRLGKRLVRVEWIGLTNLIMARNVVREFVQDDVTAEAMSVDLADWLGNSARRAKFASHVDALREKLGTPGCWERTATAATELIR
jgi:lipid-A-disaccharide synthase